MAACESQRGKNRRGEEEVERKGGNEEVCVFLCLFLWRQLKCSQTRCINQDFMDSFGGPRRAADETGEEEDK